ncbi:MAG TPA: hypothetical protein ENF42_00775 [Candidatus Bathyarchaeota archaeon]|nr:hypothetical protein [Candidatus Bathyarchaeota archaeon]
MGYIHGVTRKAKLYKVLLAKLIANREEGLPASMLKHSLEDTSVIDWLLEHGCLKLVDGKVKISSVAQLVLNMGRLGLNLHEASWWLTWKEFEMLASSILVENNLNTKPNFMFTHQGKRYQVDIVAWEGNSVYLIDCKQWFSSGVHGLRRAVEKQKERAAVLSKIYPGNELKLYPLILTVQHVNVINGVPILSLDMLIRFDAHEFSDYFHFYVGKRLINCLKNG